MAGTRRPAPVGAGRAEPHEQTGAQLPARASSSASATWSAATIPATNASSASPSPNAANEQRSRCATSSEKWRPNGSSTGPRALRRATPPADRPQRTRRRRHDARPTTAESATHDRGPTEANTATWHETSPSTTNRNSLRSLEPASRSTRHKRSRGTSPTRPSTRRWEPSRSCIRDKAAATRWCPVPTKIFVAAWTTECSTFEGNGTTEAELRPMLSPRTRESRLPRSASTASPCRSPSSRPDS